MDENRLVASLINRHVNNLCQSGAFPDIDMNFQGAFAARLLFPMSRVQAAVTKIVDQRLFAAGYLGIHDRSQTPRFNALVKEIIYNITPEQINNQKPNGISDVRK